MIFLITSEFVGHCKWYHLGCADRIEEVMDAYDVVIENYKAREDYPKNDNIKEQIEELGSLVKPTADALKNFYFSDGYAGFSTEYFAQGDDVIPVALDFYDELKNKVWRADYLEKNADAETYEKECIDSAKNNPQDDMEMDMLINMLYELVEFNNEYQYESF